MEVILLERIGKLGQMGDVVRVKDGYARNFLLPRGKALRATDENKSKFEGMKAELQARNLELKGGAEKIADKLDGKTFTVIRQAAKPASCTARSRPAISPPCSTTTAPRSNRTQVVLNTPIKTIGQHKVPLALHPEVEVSSPSSSPAAPTRPSGSRAAKTSPCAATDAEEEAPQPWLPRKPSSSRKRPRHCARRTRRKPSLRRRLPPNRARRQRAERRRPRQPKALSDQSSVLGLLGPWTHKSTANVRFWTIADKSRVLDYGRFVRL